MTSIFSSCFITNCLFRNIEWITNRQQAKPVLFKSACIDPVYGLWSPKITWIGSLPTIRCSQLLSKCLCLKPTQFLFLFNDYKGFVIKSPRKRGTNSLCLRHGAKCFFFKTKIRSLQKIPLSNIFFKKRLLWLNLFLYLQLTERQLTHKEEGSITLLFLFFESWNVFVIFTVLL